MIGRGPAETAKAARNKEGSIQRKSARTADFSLAERALRSPQIANEKEPGLEAPPALRRGTFSAFRS